MTCRLMDSHLMTSAMSLIQTNMKTIMSLAVVEAKRTSKDPHVDQQQAKLYADCLEEMKGRRQVIFYTNVAESVELVPVGVRVGEIGEAFDE